MSLQVAPISRSSTRSQYLTRLENGTNSRWQLLYTATGKFWKHICTNSKKSNAGRVSLVQYGASTVFLFVRWSGSSLFNLLGLLVRPRAGNSPVVQLPKENEKPEPFSYWKKVRIFLVWCTSRDSNPGPTD